LLADRIAARILDTGVKGVGAVMEVNESLNDDRPQEVARRKFLTSAGKFAAVTPPAVAMLLSTSLEANALAVSCIGGKRGNLGWKRKFAKKHPKKGNKFTQKPGRPHRFG
jgi:hypothetical protein